MKITAAILVTSHKHGTDYGLYRDEAEAYKALYDYVITFWDELDGEPIPEGEQEAIDKYYEIMAYDEWWEICTRSLDLGGSDLRSLRLNEAGFPEVSVSSTSDEEEIK